jgi:transposase
MLCEQEYARQALRGRGLLRRSIANMTGLSRAPITRWLARYVATGQGCVKSGRRHRFPQRYSRADSELLAKAASS